MDAAEGHYYRKQIGCKSSVIAWSHGARFKKAIQLIGQPAKLLDYGCGDGSFLAMVADNIDQGCGADIDGGQIADCRERMASIEHLRFCEIAELDETHAGTWDVVTCMETLEHCTAPIVEVVLKDLARMVAPDGRVIISVPIEIGPTFLLKYVIRKLAAWRNLSDYRYYESYSLANAWRMLTAGRKTVVERPVYGEDETEHHSHYGFNWRAMRETVRGHLHVQRTQFTPLGWLGGWFSSQVWFICRPLNSP